MAESFTDKTKWRRVYVIGDRKSGVTLIALNEDGTGAVKVFRITHDNIVAALGEGATAQDVEEAFATAGQEVWSFLIHNEIDGKGHQDHDKPNVDENVKEYLDLFRGKSKLDGADFCVGRLVSLEVHEHDHLAQNRRKSYSVLHELVGKMEIPVDKMELPKDQSEFAGCKVEDITIEEPSL